MPESKDKQSLEAPVNVGSIEERSSQDKFENSPADKDNMPQQMLRHKSLTTYEVVSLLLSLVGLYSLS